MPTISKSSTFIYLQNMQTLLLTTCLVADGRNYPRLSFPNRRDYDYGRDRLGQVPGRRPVLEGPNEPFGCIKTRFLSHRTALAPCPAAMRRTCGESCRGAVRLRGIPPGCAARPRRRAPHLCHILPRCAALARYSAIPSSCWLNIAQVCRKWQDIPQVRPHLCHILPKVTHLPDIVPARRIRGRITRKCATVRQDSLQVRHGTAG